MSIQTLKQEVEKISLTKDQKIKVNNHFIKVKKLIENLGYSNVQKQGSFGRGTVISGQESDGFDLDIAVVINSNNILEALELNKKIYEILKKEYSGPIQEVSIGEKAVKVKVNKNFSIDVTQIYKNNSEELVFNSKKHNFEISYALTLRDMFRTKNLETKNNALRDLARIYKHVRDSINDIDIKSLALEIFLFKSFKIDSTYEQTMFETLKNVEILLNAKIKDNTFNKIENPAYQSDIIKTGIETLENAKKIIILNTLVIKVIEATIVHDQQFHRLQRRFASLEQIQNSYKEYTVIPENKTVITGGTFGGNYLD